MQSPEFINPRYGDRYFSRQDGLAERLLVFLEGNGLPGALAADILDFQRGSARGSGGSPPPPHRYCCAETGFGAGLNLCALLYSLGQQEFSPGPLPDLHWYSVEEAPLAPDILGSLLGGFAELSPFSSRLVRAWEGVYRTTLQGRIDFEFDIDSAAKSSALRVSVHLWVGDVLEGLRLWSESGIRVGYWFFDGHSPAKNPAMWSPDVFAAAAALSVPGATSFATYTAAGFVKRGLRAAGFSVRRRPGFAGKHHRICGLFEGSSERQP